MPEDERDRDSLDVAIEAAIERSEEIERDALDHVWLFTRARTMKNQGTNTEKAMRGPIDRYFEHQPVGTELFDGEHGVGLRKEAGSGSRYLDFEAVPVDLLEWAAGAGLLSLNVTALDGACASSDLRTQHYAQQLALHVKSGGGTRLTTITERS